MVFSRTIRSPYALLLAVCLSLPVPGLVTAAQGSEAASGWDSLTVEEIDARLAAISPDSTLSEREGGLFLKLLSLAGTDLSEDDERIVKQHVARVIPLLPDSLRDHIAREHRRRDLDRWVLPFGAGEVLIAWWRSEDPMPATDRNERVDEHIRRVSYALREFAAETPAGYDDRGEIYVRFGEPYQRREISYADGRMIREVFRFGVPVTLSDFPDNEIWTYPHIDHSIFYIFVSENRRPFRIGSSEDLLPRRLRIMSTTSPRSMNISVSSLAAMRHILERLALIHSDFGSRYDQVDNYALWQEERRMLRSAGAPLNPGEQEQVVGAGMTGMAVYSNPMMSMSPINDFVRSSLTESRILDRHSERAREEAAPLVHSVVLEDEGVDEIVLAVRPSRFLAPDGTTRVFVDWAPLPGMLDLDDERREALEASGHDQYRDAILFLTMLEENDRFARLSTERDTFALLASHVEGRVITPQTVHLPSFSSGSHLAVQLDRYVASVRTGPPLNVLLGPQIQVGLQRSDRLEPLRSDGTALEMSDLRPMFTLFTAAALASADDPLENTDPFPFSFAPSQGSLVLQFEVYNLMFDADDRTRYLIEYEVARRDRERGLRGVLGQTRLERTAARTEHEGQHRVAQEYIVLDPAEWTGESELILTVRVTDAVAGRSVERSLVFGG